VKLGVGVGEPVEERELLATRRGSVPSLPPVPSEPGNARPFAWVLTASIEEVLVGPDWAW
jgi:hypothetical protein